MTFRFHKFNNNNQFSENNVLSKIRESNTNTKLNIKTINSLQMTNNGEYNKQLKKAILERDLENELTKRNIINDNNIQNILSLMLTFNCYLPDNTKIDNNERSTNDVQCSNIILCFQLLLKYLFKEKEKIKLKNKSLEHNSLNLKSPNYNKKISELEKKKLKLKLFLNINGVDLEPKTTNKLYVCDVCPYPYRKFNNYQDFHKHYVKRHINPYLEINNNYKIVNQAFDKDYFDKKLDELNEEVNDVFQNSKIQKKEKDFKEKGNNINFLIKNNNFINNYGIRRNKRYETVGPNMNHKSLDLKNRSSSNNKIKNEYIRKRIEIIQNNQKDFELNFQKQIESFMKEFKNELLKIKQNQTDE